MGTKGLQTIYNLTTRGKTQKLQQVDSPENSSYNTNKDIVNSYLSFTAHEDLSTSLKVLTRNKKDGIKTKQLS